MEGITILHPTEKTSVGSQRNNRKALDVQAPLETVGIDGQEVVNQAEQLHNSLVLTQIFVTYGNFGKVGKTWIDAYAHL